MRVVALRTRNGAASALVAALAAPLAAVLPHSSAAAADAPPPLGRYDAELCVAIGTAAASCGPADLEWRRAGRARLRISDFVYTLRLRTGQVDVTLQHGAMQIDAFTAIYEWDGGTLRFVDVAKDVRYELRSGRAR